MFKKQQFTWTEIIEKPDSKPEFYERHYLLMNTDVSYFLELINDRGFGFYETFTRITGKPVTDTISDLQLEVIYQPE